MMKPPAVFFVQLALLLVSIAYLLYRDRERGIVLLAQVLVTGTIIRWTMISGEVKFPPGWCCLPWPYALNLYGANLPHFLPHLVLSCVFVLVMAVLARGSMARRQRVVPLCGIWIFLLSVVFFLVIGYVVTPLVEY
jgi:hypothetical protein